MRLGSSAPAGLWRQFHSFNIKIPKDSFMYFFFTHARVSLEHLFAEKHYNKWWLSRTWRQFHSFNIEIPEGMQAEWLGLICTPHPADKPCWKHWRGSRDRHLSACRGNQKKVWGKNTKELLLAHYVTRWIGLGNIEGAWEIVSMATEPARVIC